MWPASKHFVGACSAVCAITTTRLTHVEVQVDFILGVMRVSGVAQILPLMLPL